MKKAKMILSAAIVLLVVGSSLAFKTINQSDVVGCIAGVCQLSQYSTQQLGMPIPNFQYTQYTLTNSKRGLNCSKIEDCFSDPNEDEYVPSHLSIYENP